MKALINKYTLIMIGMVLVVAIGVVQNMHENQMAAEAEAKAAAVQQQKVIDQGNQAKVNTDWKLNHHGEIPAYKD
jgi:hypothetical protein|uniref:Uncharacterized protein n=1 Tax=Myoviridae sp. ctBrv3 TaxID=2825047 RepID=A0A8S5PD79_9CAUD|nr:MAG TPA: hypothetical protein [Myoviridae sp. ctBrv3]